MDTFDLTITRKYFFNLLEDVEVLRDVKELVPLRDLQGFILAVFKDNTQRVVNLNRYDYYDLPIEFFHLVKNRASKDAQGKANIQE
jgi:hypothetical protein